MKKIYKFLVLLSFFALSACGGGGDSAGQSSDSIPVLSITDVSVSEGETGTQLTFSVSLSKMSDSAVTVDYATSDGTATAGEDYAGVAGTLTIDAGMTGGEINVAVVGDSMYEGDETLTLNFSNVSGATLANTVVTGTILNDDPLPSVSISDASVAEGNSGTTNLIFTVSLGSVSSLPVSLEYVTVDGVALSASDFVTVSDIATIAAGETSTTITVSVNGDAEVEGDETFIVVLSNPSGATISDAEATGTILNDDGVVSVGLSIASVSVSEGTGSSSEMIFTVSLSSPSAADVSVDYGTNNGTAFATLDFLSTSGTLTIPAGQTTGQIVVSIVGDGFVEADETFTITLSNPSTNATLLAGTATGTIVNDDAHLISVSDVQVKEGDGGTKKVVFYLNSEYAIAQQSVSFDYTTVNGSAMAGEDYTAVSGSVSFNPGELLWTAVSVDINGDIVVEQDETFTLQLSGATGVSFSANSITATILNDDADVSVANTRALEGDSGPVDLVFTISLDQPLAGDVSFDFATGIGSADNGIDYTGVSGRATINAGNTQTTVAVSVSGDTDVEQNEIVPFVISNVSGAVLGRSVAFGIIENDDGGKQVNLPITGQNECFDGNGDPIACAGTGQDGEHRSGSGFLTPRFMNNGDGTVVDSLTGIVWPADGNIMSSRDPGYDREGVADDGIVTWQAALAYVAKLNEESYLGYNDWRLPNRNELRSLINYGVADNAVELHSNGFSNYASSYWSSSSYFSADAVSAAAWVVNMVSGYIFPMDKSELVVAFMGVVPVRGGNMGYAKVPLTAQTQCYSFDGTMISCDGTGQDGEYQQGIHWPEPRFSTGAGTTVTDSLTGLIWAPDANVMATRDPTFDTEGNSGDGKVSWQTALDYVAKLNAEAYLGYRDWSLPNVNELQSLINIENQMTAYPQLSGWLYSNGFSNIGDQYWSSTTYRIFPGTAWSVHVGSSALVLPYAGAMPAAGKSVQYYVWPVRRAIISLSINSNADDMGPEISSDDLSLYFHSNRAGGQGGIDIWVSSRATTGTGWSGAVNLGAAINSAADDRAPTVSQDNLTLIFASNRNGNNDLYVSTRASVSDPWGSPVGIGASINTANDESGPSLSTDGLALYFHSDRPGGLGAADIYVSTRAGTSDPWGAPTPVSVVNSAEFDVAPDVSADGLALYFHSPRLQGVGGHDIWVSKRATTADAWGTPEVLVSPINTFAIETGASISNDNRTLYFSSDRIGSTGRDIWQFTW
ncbi:MAG: DUF1566 domain-containing protein [Gammaproteobacteria bacterium]|nr:DUF1566 domain-containing protein [Gammaproteobacteria bacterium]MDH5802925.1 DUF1566 domain-containing protein [Gammaproteobacteria bacterium]